ncbi:MAG: hypothetical protein HYZ22_16985 [Chloroflexi bacterium]|nr:hypothetical protein [Chloroflexota bacterium]
MSASKTQLAIIAVAIVLLFALVQFLYDPISSVEHLLEVSHIHDQFPVARSQWDAAAIQDYSFEIRGSSQSICAVDALVEVQNNIVTEVTPLQNTFSLPPEKWADPDWGNEVFLCDYNHFTIPRIFDMVEKTLQNAPTSILEIEFDLRYGFVTDFRDGIFLGHGWLDPKIGAVYNEFQIRNFRQH